MHHREDDACPSCSLVTRLDESMKHAMSCGAHPSLELGRRAEGVLGRLLGEAEARSLSREVGERDRLVNALRALLVDCNAFESDCGWNGDCAYAHHGVQEAFKRAIRTAEAEVSRAAPAVEAAPLDDPGMHEGLTQVRREEAEARAGLQRLLGFCLRFLGAFGDDDRGRALVPNYLESSWEEERAEAGRTLGRLGVADPWSCT
jgi:hypothetical protein